MTSQKRYRHHKENNGSRVRDLPPRFKRQKASPSPPPGAATTLAPQTSSTISHTSTLERTDSPKSVNSPAVMAPSSNSSVYPNEDNYSPQRRPRTAIGQVPVTNALQWSPRVNGAFVLSPWDTGYINTVQNTQSHVPLGTQVGYELSSPPLSPWASRGILNNAGQQNVTSNPAWITSQTDLYMNQRNHSSSAYFNENWVPSQNVMHHQRPNTMLSKLSTSLQCSRTTSPKQSSISVATKLSDINKNCVEKQNSGSREVDYSDPDIRTIEMLRELERVADEREIECDDLGVDRKSLVSHHLRMLMCAVDRYTEGIEDDIAVASRSDEVAASSQSCGATPQVSPVPSEMWTRKQIQEVKNETKPDSDISLWSPGYETSLWKYPKPVMSASGNSEVPAYSHKALYSSPQASPVSRYQGMENQDSANWDLWSSPSFDFSGVLTSPEHVIQNLLGGFSGKSDRDRKPLYQR